MVHAERRTHGRVAREPVPMIPRATYRFQLNAAFTFRDATSLVPYLAELGISHVYCSPYFRARPGSTHGYDAVDHNSINPEIGTREEFEEFVRALRAAGMGHIADFVPNHVGIGHDNAWWTDVLANGRDSRYAPFFDIDWGATNKVLLPVLGEPYGEVLARGELRVARSPEGPSFEVHYHTHRFPIARKDDELARKIVDGAQGDADALHDLLEKQFYRLAYWRVAGDEINYRRFFDVSELAALRMENPQVFAETHRLVLELIHAGKIDGLRIDHPDGLFDPAAYFEQLQRAVCGDAAHGSDGPRFYVLAEKITAGFEQLPLTWAVDGTTGYHFTNVVNGLFVDSKSRGALSRIYRAFVHSAAKWPQVAYECKHLILDTSLAAEMNVLTLALARIAWRDRQTRDFTQNILRRVLKEIIACFPVYRSYVTDTFSEQDRRFIDSAVSSAQRNMPTVDASVFDFVRHALLAEPIAGMEYARAELRAFAMKFQQVSAPTTAKGIEDTAMYRFNRLVSLNEVGGEPDDFGISVRAYHADSSYRAKHWPHEMLTTSTHDTKRAEDVRARINVISELPTRWKDALHRWHLANRGSKPHLKGMVCPSVNDEYLLYQVLIGSWQGAADAAERSAYVKRIAAYMIKAAREAKIHTSWANANADYEAGVTSFIGAILEPGPGNEFLTDFERMHPVFAWFGYLNSLAQTTCKLMAPGMPDIYQGTELWDFSLVDPDNRRAVDYARRAAELSRLRPLLAEPSADGASELLRPLSNGRVKLYVTAKLLGLRRTRAELFATGGYIPLKTRGHGALHVCAFARKLSSTNFVIVAVPRLCTQLMQGEPELPLGERVWHDTQVELPPKLSVGESTHVLTGRQIRTRALGERMVVDAHELFEHFPIAVLVL